MGETTIRVSEEFRARVKAPKDADETMEETLRRLTRGPHPREIAGVLSPGEAEALKESVDELREGDADRKRRARDAFEPNESG